jgi:hypothetical protein
MIDNPVNGFGKRGWRMVLVGSAGLALLVLALFLAGVVRSTDLLAQRLRYVSICTRCGVQTAEDFYLVLGTEVLKCEKVLPASESTKVKEGRDCLHESALIGKSGWLLTKEFATAGLEAGEPRGWNYDGGELEKHLAALNSMRPAETIRYMHALSTVKLNGSAHTNGVRPTAP